MNWEAQIMQGRTVWNSQKSAYEFIFEFPTEALVRDVVFDLVNGNFDSADIEFFDPYEIGTVPGQTMADTFKIQTYIQIEFIPEDTSLDHQIEFVRVDIPYRNKEDKTIGVRLL